MEIIILEAKFKVSNFKIINQQTKNSKYKTKNINSKYNIKQSKNSFKILLNF